MQEWDIRLKRYLKQIKGNYSYKGITDWDDITEIIGKNIYVLNENYRNTLQITSLPVLVTTHNVGKNLTNPNIRFIVHFDIPAERELYQLHLSQIGSLAENHMIYDLNSAHS